MRLKHYLTSVVKNSHDPTRLLFFSYFAAEMTYCALKPQQRDDDSVIPIHHPYPLLSLTHIQKPPRSACCEVKINRRRRTDFFHLKNFMDDPLSHI